MQRIEIRVKGQIKQQWSEWFGGLTINYSDPGETTLSGLVPIRLRCMGSFPACGIWAYN